MYISGIFIFHFHISIKKNIHIYLSVFCLLTASLESKSVVREAVEGDCVVELGVYGVFVCGARCLNEPAGHLLRAKLKGVDEVLVLLF